MRKLTVLIVVLVLVGLSLGGWYKYKPTAPKPYVVTNTINGEMFPGLPPDLVIASSTVLSSTKSIVNDSVSGKATIITITYSTENKSFSALTDYYTIYLPKIGYRIGTKIHRDTEEIIFASSNKVNLTVAMKEVMPNLVNVIISIRTPQI